jgi:acetoin utilization protein AcuC
MYDDRMAQYRFSRAHPMVPERFTLAVDLMSAWGLLSSAGGDGADVVHPEPCTVDDLLLAHGEQYVSVVCDEYSPVHTDEWYGLGEGDTPRFPHMHEAASLAVGGTLRALFAVLDGQYQRAFAPAGGLHHAHRDGAAGFCVYNDCAVAIAKATAEHDGLRVAYVDIDAHHGDGVQEAFVDRSDVLTISVHESGRYLYPGTGAARDIGEGAGRGFSVNVPLPPYSAPADYERVFEGVIEPALDAFEPDVIVAQLGADAHAADPLTHLRLTVAGHSSLVRHIVAASDALCGGRLAATGGGGYDAYCATPRAWASVMAVLLGDDVPAELPPAWLERAAEMARRATVSQGCVTRTFDEMPMPEQAVTPAETSRLVDVVISDVRSYSPLLERSSL